MTVNLTSNQIRTIHQNYFNSLKFTKHIILKGNRIQSMEQRSFINVTKISIIDLSNNKLETLLPFKFSNVSLLCTLDIRKNRIFQINKRTFSNLLMNTILISSQSVCFIKPTEVICYTTGPIFSSCSGIYPDMAMRVVSIFMSSVVILVNVIPFIRFIWLWREQSLFISYQILVVIINFGNIVEGEYLFNVWAYYH